MRKRWYVIDEDNELSWSVKNDSSEHFATIGAAQKRAVECANLNPGKVYFICETVKFADAEVEPATYKVM